MYKQAQKNNFKTFVNDMKVDKIGNILLLHGEEQYLVKWAVDALTKKFVNPTSKSMDFAVFDDEKVETDSIIQFADTFSMFSEKRVLWIKNYKPLSGDNPKGYSSPDLNPLIEYIKNNNSSTLMIFSCEEIKKTEIVKAINKNGQEYEFSQLTRGELFSFAKKIFRSNNVEISPRLLSQLIDTTGYFNRESEYRLYNFENDILKIIAHSDERIIKENDILLSVSSDMETFVFDMLDGISNNQKDKAFKILYNMLHSGAEVFSVIGAIVSQFELMLTVKEYREDGLNLDEIHGKIGGSEYRIKKMMPYAAKYSTEKLKKTLSDIYEVDRNIKNGLLDGQLGLELFIAKI